MIKFDDGLSIFFKHYPEETGISFDDDGKPMPFYGRTLCIIEQNGESLRDGEAYCGINEPRFDKSIGRKVSLARALDGADKELKTKIWKKYLETVKKT